VLALGCLLALGVLYRPLLLSSVNPELAAARGVPVRLTSLLFLVVVGVAAAITIPTVGTLLIFSLIVGPAGAAVHLAHRPLTVLLVSVGLGDVAGHDARLRHRMAGGFFHLRHRRAAVPGRTGHWPAAGGSLDPRCTRGERRANAAWRSGGWPPSASWWWLRALIEEPAGRDRG
jgi:hypothetical protein